jgi:hypothetical protein
MVFKKWASYVLGFPFAYLQRKLSSSRPAITEAEFIARIERAGGDSEAARLIWKELLDSWVNPRFTPYPEDDLLRVYGIADEELDDDLILETLRKLGLPIPDQQHILDFGPVSSPLRFAQFISMCRQVRRL